jgi:hypothetical protein
MALRSALPKHRMLSTWTCCSAIRYLPMLLTDLLCLPFPTCCSASLGKELDDAEIKEAVKILDSNSNGGWGWVQVAGNQSNCSNVASNSNDGWIGVTGAHNISGYTLWDGLGINAGCSNSKVGGGEWAGAG